MELKQNKQIILMIQALFMLKKLSIMSTLDINMKLNRVAVVKKRVNLIWLNYKKDLKE